MGLFDLFGSRAPAGYRDITVGDFEGEHVGARLVDVREPDEFVEAHIKNSELVPLSGLMNSCGDWDRNQPYILICRSGNRSGTAAQMMAQKGFTNLMNLAGGMIAWQRAGYEIEKGAPKK